MQQRVLLDGVRERRIILIAGGTASGKTTLANALIREIGALGDPTERIVILPRLARAVALDATAPSSHPRGTVLTITLRGVP